MTDVDALEPLSAGEGAATPRPRIDPLTRLLVLRLKAAEPGRSAASIARVVGEISEQSVRRLLAQQTSDEKALTQQMMATAIVDRLENWERACEVAAEKGYHQPSKDYLEAAKVIEAKPHVQANVNVKPSITLAMNFGLGALAQYQPQPPAAIETQVLPALPPKDAA